MERLPVDAGGTASRRRRGPARTRCASTSAKAAGLANTQTEIDVATFTQWVNAYAQKQTELADFYFKRFRKEFRPAVNAWVATQAAQEPERAADAVRDAAVQARGAAPRPTGSTRKRSSTPAQARRDIQRASNYVLGVVLFASALFFAGMSTKLTLTEAARRDALDRLRRLSLHRRLDRDLAGQRHRLSATRAPPRKP